MSEKNLFGWNALIARHAQHGCGNFLAYTGILSSRDAVECVVVECVVESMILLMRCLQ